MRQSEKMLNELGVFVMPSNLFECQQLVLELQKIIAQQSKELGEEDKAKRAYARSFLKWLNIPAPPKLIEF